MGRAEGWRSAVRIGLGAWALACAAIGLGGSTYAMRSTPSPAPPKLALLRAAGEQRSRWQVAPPYGGRPAFAAPRAPGRQNVAATSGADAGIQPGLDGNRVYRRRRLRAQGGSSTAAAGLIPLSALGPGYRVATGRAQLVTCASLLQAVHNPRGSRCAQSDRLLTARSARLSSAPVELADLSLTLTSQATAVRLYGIFAQEYGRVGRTVRPPAHLPAGVRSLATRSMLRGTHVTYVVLEAGRRLGMVVLVGRNTAAEEATETRLWRDKALAEGRPWV